MSVESTSSLSHGKYAGQIGGVSPHRGYTKSSMNYQELLARAAQVYGIELTNCPSEFAAAASPLIMPWTTLAAWWGLATKYQIPKAIAPHFTYFFTVCSLSVDEVLLRVIPGSTSIRWH